MYLNSSKKEVEKTISGKIKKYKWEPVCYDISLTHMQFQFSSVAQSCPTLCNPMNRSTPGLPVHHKLPEFTQTHAHRVSDAIQPSHPLLSPSPPALNPSQHQGLFQWVNSSHEVAKVLEFQPQHQSFQWTSKTDLLQHGLVGSSCSPRDSQESSPTAQFMQFKFNLIQESQKWDLRKRTPSLSSSASAVGYEANHQTFLNSQLLNL